MELPNVTFTSCAQYSATKGIKMKQWIPDLPKGSWTRVIGWTALVTTFVTASAVAGSYFGAEWLNGGAKWGDVFVAFALAVTLAPLISAFMLMKLQELHLANQKLKIYATTDSLTGALSRGAFTAEVEHLLAHPSGNSEHRGSLLILDVDKFKRINDSFGHQQGDLALRLISAAIRANVRSFDRVGRLGGEEFGVFLVESAPEYARVAAERIREAITEIEFMPDFDHMPLSISIGISMADEHAGFADLYHSADMSLYRAKSNGRNQVVMENDWGEDRRRPPAPVSSVA